MDEGMSGREMVVVVVVVVVVVAVAVVFELVVVVAADVLAAPIRASTGMGRRLNSIRLPM